VSRQLGRALSVAALLGAAVGLRSVAYPGAPEHVIQITAKRFEYTPSEIVVKRGEAVRIEIASLDRKHGFTIPDLAVRGDVKPGGKAVIRFTPSKTGRFNFHCDLFCGSGHEGMAGTLVVTD
jgi:cytochrome c oxidase subunit 2